MWLKGKKPTSVLFVFKSKKQLTACEHTSVGTLRRTTALCQGQSPSRGTWHVHALPRTALSLRWNLKNTSRHCSVPPVPSPSAGEASKHTSVSSMCPWSKAAGSQAKITLLLWLRPRGTGRWHRAYSGKRTGGRGFIVMPHRSGGGTQPDWKTASDLGELASYYTNLWVRLLTQGKSGLGLLEPSTVWHQPGCGPQPSAPCSHPTVRPTSITTTEPRVCDPTTPEPCEPSRAGEWQELESGPAAWLWADELEDSIQAHLAHNSATQSSKWQTTCETLTTVSMQVMAEHTENLGSRNLIWSTEDEECWVGLLQLCKGEGSPLREGTARHSRWPQAGGRMESWQRWAGEPASPSDPPKATNGTPPRKLRLQWTFKKDDFFLTVCKNCHQWQISRISPKHLKSFTAF